MRNASMMLPVLIIISAVVIHAGFDIGYGASPKRARVSHGEANGGLPHTLAKQSPNWGVAVHKYNNVRFCVSNFGVLGSEGGSYTDPETGQPARSFEFPAGSQVEYLFQGAIWIGAVVGSDTLVSVGADGWQHVNELWPCGDPSCAIERRSNRPGDPYYHPDAVSDLDYIAEYTDTLDDPAWTGVDWSGRPHIPIDLKIVQKSYSWSEPGYDEFVLVEFEVSTLSVDSINDAYVGVFMDCDIGHDFHEYDRYLDDISGFREEFPDPEKGGVSDTFNCAWASDNDGDPVNDVWDVTSARGVLGVAYLDPLPGLANAPIFNWWQGNGSSALDWGPWLAENDSIWDFGTGGMGTPEGDLSKHFVLSNGETDYDQLFSAVDFSADGWLPPSDFGEGFANGMDTRFLLSCGPVDIGPEPIRFAVVFAAGEGFHVAPNDFEDLFDPADPTAYYESLDFSGLAATLRAAREKFTEIHLGDADWNGEINIDDVISLIDYLWFGGPGPKYRPSADVYCDGRINALDLICIVNYIFRGVVLPCKEC